MNTTKKLICLLAAGATLAAASPAFADRGHTRERDYQSAYRHYDGRYADRGEHRGWDRRRAVVVHRPMIVEHPVYYARPAPRRDIDVIAPALIIGAVIGSYMFSHQ
ncbi:MAG: hypothetical protein IH606_20755 [Burkholderiales bacterium]|nr:hypothetical protein [Burkholderiales bacterium]